MGFRNFDPSHTGEILKFVPFNQCFAICICFNFSSFYHSMFLLNRHMDRQNEVLMEAYRSMFNELRKLQIEEEMLMRKMHEVISAQGLSKSVDEQEPVSSEPVPPEELFLWEAQPMEEATWEEAETNKEKCTYLCLEDKVEIRQGAIDGNPFPMVLTQPTSEKPLKVYTRRSKALVPKN
ncbi:hypothetical protein VNO78_03229 [Psophocarpus tetragonolobus]|uniref:Uncharacterized protein n=1 Tax=Psophocarpus tetragonolobus TaxID=3891 RepID=A0AAN9T1U9_PSOTE